MKITSSGLPAKTLASERGGRAGERPGASGSATNTREPAAKVNLSPEAGFLAALQDEVSVPTEVRQDLVDEVRAQLRDGTFERGVDMDKMLDSLLADL